MPESYIPDGCNPWNIHKPKVIGHVYKGTEKIKGGHGSNLDEFLRFTPVDGVQGDRALRIFKQHYEGQPSDGRGWLTKQPIRLYFPFDEWWKNVVVGYGAYGRGSGMQRFCTGSRIVREKRELEIPAKGRVKARKSFRYGNPNAPCPNAHEEFPCEQCGGPQSGYIRQLRFYIKELYDAGLKQLVILNNTAINEAAIVDQVNIGLSELQRQFGANVSGIPAAQCSMPDYDQFVMWELCRTPEMIGKPVFHQGEATGNQKKEEEWLLSLTVSSEWTAIAKQRYGRGHYYDKTGNGDWVNAEQEKLKFLKEVAGTVREMAQLGGMASRFLPGNTAAFAPQRALAAQPEYMEVLEAELTPDDPIGVNLSGTEPVPLEVAEALGCSDAPLRPEPNEANRDRLKVAADLLELTTEEIAAAIARDHGEGVKSVFLSQEAMRTTLKRLMIMWAEKQTYENGEPMFLGDEAEEFMKDFSSQLRGHDATQVNKWKDHILQRRSIGTTEAKQARPKSKPSKPRKAS